jgi:hypothetical protein
MPLDPNRTLPIDRPSSLTRNPSSRWACCSGPVVPQREPAALVLRLARENPSWATGA